MRTLVVVMWVAACGDDGGMVQPDGATADAASDAAAVDAIGPGREGLVFLNETRGSGGPGSRATASFFVGKIFGGPAASTTGCDGYTTTDEGGESAGDITVTGTTTPITIVPTGSSPMVTYDAQTAAPVDLFAPSATLSITAAGATVPAFAGSVTAPAPIAGASVPTMISRASPPTFTWTAGSSNEVWIWVGSLDAGNEYLVWCRTTDSGSFAVSAAAMAMIPASATQGYAVLWRTAQTPISAGQWDITLVAADVVLAFAAIGP